MKYSDKEKRIASMIGHFYLNKEMESNGSRPETFSVVCTRVDQLGITHIHYNEKENRISIALARPGIFIGAKGKNIESFRAYLYSEFPEVKIKIVENNIDLYLYTFSYDGQPYIGGVQDEKEQVW